MSSLHPRGLSYSERAEKSENQATKSFLGLVARKKSNLSIAADVRTKAELLHIADTLGPYMCLLKTHIDTLDDFDLDLTRQLSVLAEKHDFMIFEDRKFADIGNTVKHQYRDGVYKISSWSHITNAHTVPGPGIIEGLKEVGAPLGRGLLLLAEMSSKGTLAKGTYSQDTIEMARNHKDFVMGFISMRRLVEDSDFVYMSPGVNLTSAGDALGQQYNTPRKIIYEQGSDVIIVGRGIYEAQDPVEMAKKYQEAGWKAYEESLQDTKAMK